MKLKQENKMFRNLVLVATVFATSIIALASNLDQLQQAKALYSQRDSVDQTQTMALVDSLIQNSTGLEKYQALIVGSGAAWWQSKAHVDNKKQKVQLNLKGIAYAEQAIQLRPDLSSGYLWRGFNTGSYGLNAGIVKGALEGRLGQMIKDLKTAMTKVTIDGKPGDMDEIYGARRVLGKLYATLAIVPGNYYKGLDLLKSAYEQGSGHILNAIFYAEALGNGNEQEIELAKKILEEVLMKSAADFDPSSLGELNYNMELAKDMRHCLDVTNVRYCLYKLR